MPNFLLNTTNKFEIDISASGDTPQWATIAAGINSVDPSFDDDIDDTPYYDGSGFNNNDVTGVKASLQFSGHRDYSDPAQNFIAGLLFETGEARKRQFRWTQPDGKVITGSATINGIKPGGGDANAKNSFEFTASFNGKPELTDGTGSGEGGTGA